MKVELFSSGPSKALQVLHDKLFIILALISELNQASKCFFLSRHTSYHMNCKLLNELQVDEVEMNLPSAFEKLLSMPAMSESPIPSLLDSERCRADPLDPRA